MNALAGLSRYFETYFVSPSHRKKREAKIKRDVKRGIREPNEQDPFEIFITVTDIRYTYVVSAFHLFNYFYITILFVQLLQGIS